MNREHTYLRDLELSARHRLYGEVPLVDLDFLGINYHHRVPSLVIEYQHGNVREVELWRANYEAIRNRWMSEKEWVRMLNLVTKGYVTEADEVAIGRLNEVVPRI